MKFDKKYLGKWVATKNEKVIASDKTLTRLVKKLNSGAKDQNVKFTLIPSANITG